MKILWVEAIGTFFLVLVVGLTTIMPGAGAMAPLAIGAILMVMVYAGAHISGAHYNPAVTLAVWMRGRCSPQRIPAYMGAQLAGAILAAVVAGWLKRGTPIVALELHAGPALLVELLFTFALAYVVLNVATSKQTSGNSYFGLAIGMTLMAAAYAGGRISGGAFNPAVAVGLTLMGASALGDLLIFLAANFAGGALAALAFRALHPDE